MNDVLFHAELDQINEKSVVVCSNNKFKPVVPTIPLTTSSVSNSATNKDISNYYQNFENHYISKNILLESHIPCRVRDVISFRLVYVDLILFFGVLMFM